MAPPTLEPIEVSGGYWMLAHMRYGVLLRDPGWFELRNAAESKALAGITKHENGRTALSAVRPASDQPSKAAGVD